jgi:hypothetical protein
MLGVFFCCITSSGFSALAWFFFNANMCCCLAEKKKQAIEKQRQVEAKKFKEEQRKHALIKASQLKAAQNSLKCLALRFIFCCFTFLALLKAASEIIY